MKVLCLSQSKEINVVQPVQDTNLLLHLNHQAKHGTQKCTGRATISRKLPMVVETIKIYLTFDPL